MEEYINEIKDLIRVMMARYPRFGGEIAQTKFEIRNTACGTAGTDGETIYVDPKLIKCNDINKKLFVIAHEFMHIKFQHMFRLKDKNGNYRDLNLWNFATDAIVNANLERDGFTIPKGFYTYPNALRYTAEELYNILLKEQQRQQQSGNNEQQNEQQEQQKQQQSENSEQQNQTGNVGDKQNEEQNQQNDKNIDNQRHKDDQETMSDDHNMWKEAFEKKEKESSSDFDDHSVDEKQEFSKNRMDRLAKAKQKFQLAKSDILDNNYKSPDISYFDSVGNSVEEFDWKKILRSDLEQDESVWSQRRSIAENNYAYRLEDYFASDDTVTEVMIDVSGSVDLDLVKSFLRVLKPILKNSKLRVGCFNANFYGLVEIKTTDDIDHFELPSNYEEDGAYLTEDWDLAVRSFTKNRDINKIVFTDGWPDPGTMPGNDLKNERVYWLVYGNDDFDPCCGKVIMITDEQLEELEAIDTSNQYSVRGR